MKTENTNSNKAALKATELRIGNLVKHLGITKPIAINANGLLAMANGSNLYEPIPLDETWLLRAEFSKEKDSKVDQWLFKNVRWDIAPHLSPVLQDRDGFLWNNIRIQYVHTLQNCYAIEGTELTFKE